MKKLFRAKFAFLLLAVVLGLSWAVGGTFAPLMRKVFASTGDSNKVVANYNISNLPRNQVALGTKLDLTASATTESRVPTMNGGYVRLFKIENTGSVDVSTHFIQSNGVISGTAGVSYDNVISYEWRFYLSGSDAKDQYLYRYPVQVYQNVFTLNVPASAQYDGEGQISWVPNVSVPGQPVVLPLPDQFVNAKGIDLFNNKEKDVEKLRKDVIQSWGTSIKKPGLLSVSDDVLAAKDSDLFKKLIWANTNITFSSPSAGSGGLIYDGTAANTTGIANRTFTPPSSGSNYYAQYTLDHPKITAAYRTANIRRLRKSLIKLSSRCRPLLIKL